MKKILYLILGVLLFIPFFVKADMSAPIIKGFKATPKSQSGAEIYHYDEKTEKYVKTNKKLAYGKIVEIDDYYDGEYDFISLDPDNEDNEDYVKFSDLVPVEKEYKIGKNELSSLSESFIIKKQEIRKGPGPAYEGTGVIIPAGAKIKTGDLLYYDEEEKEYAAVYTMWVYVEYNGTKGFVDSEYNIAGINAYTTFICLDECKIVNNDETKILANIKENEKINATLYKLYNWQGDSYYIEYGNIKGTIDGSPFVKKTSATFKSSKDIKVYENLDKDDDNNIVSKVVTTIPKATSFTSNYYYADNGAIIIYYEKGDMKGWIDLEGEEIPEEEDDDGDGYLPWYEMLEYPSDIEDGLIIKVEKGANDANNSAVTILTTPIDIPKEDEENTDSNDEISDAVSNENTDNKISDDVSDENKDKEDVQKLTKKIPVLVYYCLGAAVIVSLTAVVTILLVNKKKKNANTEEVKEESKEDIPIEEKNNEEK